MAQIKSQPQNWHEKVIISPLLDDISGCNFTDGWMLTSYLGIQNCPLIFLKLTKLFPDKIWLKFDTL